MAKEVYGKVTLLDVRLSFPALFTPDEQKQDDGTIRQTFKANALIPKDQEANMFGKFKGVKMPLKQALQKAADEAKTRKWGADQSKWPKLKPDRVFKRDGDLENWDGYAGCLYTSANSKVENPPVVVTNRKDTEGNWIPAKPGQAGCPYSGCYVNMTIVIWGQDNEHGKRLNAEIKSVQFLRDGDPFSGQAPSNPNEDFDEDDVSSEGGDFDHGGEDGGDDDDMI